MNTRNPEADSNPEQPVQEVELVIRIGNKKTTLHVRVEGHQDPNLVGKMLDDAKQHLLHPLE